MSGNVSEMVKETSFVKGGSWNDSHDQLTVNVRIPNSGEAKRTIGFRYFEKIQ